MTPGGVEVTGKTAESLPAGHWSNYPITAVRRISSNFGASGLKGVDVSISCDIPPVSVASPNATRNATGRRTGAHGYRAAVGAHHTTARHAVARARFARACAAVCSRAKDARAPQTPQGLVCWLLTPRPPPPPHTHTHIHTQANKNCCLSALGLCVWPQASGMSTSSAIICGMWLALGDRNNLEDHPNYKENIDRKEDLMEYLGCAGFF